MIPLYDDFTTGGGEGEGERESSPGINFTRKGHTPKHIYIPVVVFREN